jgi:hypothetical protein
MFDNLIRLFNDEVGYRVGQFTRETGVAPSHIGVSSTTLMMITQGLAHRYAVSQLPQLTLNPGVIVELHGLKVVAMDVPQGEVHVFLGVER